MKRWRRDKQSKKSFLFFATVLLWPVAAFANGNDRHMGDWGHMMGGGMFMWILFLVIIVVAIYFILQSTKSRSSDSSSKETPRETAIEILKKRYAQGEITKEEFEKMKKDLES